MIFIPFRPGQFVLEGEVLAEISPSSAMSSLTPTVMKTNDLGRHRVLAQDLEFGIAQIVEIAKGVRRGGTPVNIRDGVIDVVRQSGAILFDKFDRRYKEGLDLILRGARAQKRPHDDRD